MLTGIRDSLKSSKLYVENIYLKTDNHSYVGKQKLLQSSTSKILQAITLA